MDIERTYTAFAEDDQIATGDLATLLRATKARLDQGIEAPVLIIDDSSGRQADFDLTGSIDEVLKRELPEAPQRGPGRPRLGVVSREVTLLPRHWEWLAEQPTGASATLRSLVEEARKNEPPELERRRLAATTGSAMTVLAGDRPNFEEAYRALDAGNSGRFVKLISDWPLDVQRYLLRLVGWSHEGSS